MARIIPLFLVCLFLWAAPAAAARYDPQKAGHPLRIAAYVLHPAGVILDYLIFRPAWSLGVREPFRTLFGVRVPPEDDPGERRAEEQPAEEPAS